MQSASIKTLSVKELRAELERREKQEKAKPRKPSKPKEPAPPSERVTVQHFIIDAHDTFRFTLREVLDGMLSTTQPDDIIFYSGKDPLTGRPCISCSFMKEIENQDFKKQMQKYHIDIKLHVIKLEKWKLAMQKYEVKLAEWQNRMNDGLPEL